MRVGPAPAPNGPCCTPGTADLDLSPLTADIDGAFLAGGGVGRRPRGPRRGQPARGSTSPASGSARRSPGPARCVCIGLNYARPRRRVRRRATRPSRSSSSRRPTPSSARDDDVRDPARLRRRPTGRSSWPSSSAAGPATWTRPDDAAGPHRRLRGQQRRLRARVPAASLRRPVGQGQVAARRSTRSARGWSPPTRSATRRPRLRRWVNGEPRQDSSTADMIFGVAAADLVPVASTWCWTPATSSTPAPRRAWRCPAGSRTCAPGDVVELEIDGLGRQRITLRDADGGMITVGRHVRRPLPDLARPGRLRRDEPRPRLLGRLRRAAHRRRRRAGGARLRLHHRPRQRRPGRRDRGAARRTWSAWTSTTTCADLGGVLAGASIARLAAALARPGEGRHAHGDRRGRQRRLGPGRQARRQAAVAAAGRHDARSSSSTWSTSATSPTRSPPTRRWRSCARGRAGPGRADRGCCAEPATPPTPHARLARLRRREAGPAVPRRPSPTASRQIKLKVGADLDDDVRRLRARPRGGRPGHPDRRSTPTSAGTSPRRSTGSSALAPFDPYWIEEPTSPDDILGHAAIRRGRRAGPGRHRRARRRTGSSSSSCCRPAPSTSCRSTPARVGGVNENIAILLLAAKFGVPVCPHAGGVGLCELVQHLSMFDYVAVSGTLEDRVIEYVDHLHEHFVDPGGDPGRPLPGADRARASRPPMRRRASPRTRSPAADWSDELDRPSANDDGHQTIEGGRGMSDFDGLAAPW